MKTVFSDKLTIASLFYTVTNTCFQTILCIKTIRFCCNFVDYDSHELCEFMLIWNTLRMYAIDVIISK